MIVLGRAWAKLCPPDASELGWTIIDGHREGNVLKWKYSDGKCVEMEVEMELLSDGKTMNGLYSGKDKCKHSEFTGKYINYQKQ